MGRQQKSFVSTLGTQANELRKENLELERERTVLLRRIEINRHKIKTLESLTANTSTETEYGQKADKKNKPLKQSAFDRTVIAVLKTSELSLSLADIVAACRAKGVKYGPADLSLRVYQSLEKLMEMKQVDRNSEDRRLYQIR